MSMKRCAGDGGTGTGITSFKCCGLFTKGHDFYNIFRLHTTKNLNIAYDIDMAKIFCWLNIKFEMEWAYFINGKYFVYLS